MIFFFFSLQSDSMVPITTQSVASTSSHNCCESVTDVERKKGIGSFSSDPSSKCAVFTVITKNVLVTCWRSRAVQNIF